MLIICVLIHGNFFSVGLTACCIWIRKCRQLRNSIRIFCCVSWRLDVRRCFKEIIIRMMVRHCNLRGRRFRLLFLLLCRIFYQERISNILTSWKDMTKTGPLLVVSMKLHIQECRQVIISLKYATRGMCLIRNIGISLFQCIFSLHGIVLHRLILFILSFSCCC